MTTSIRRTPQIYCGRWAPAYILNCDKITGRSPSCPGISATPRRSGTPGAGRSSSTTDCSPPSKTGKHARRRSTASTPQNFANASSPPSHIESNRPRRLVNWPNGERGEPPVSLGALHLTSRRRCPHPAATGITGCRTAIKTLQIGRDGLPAVGHAEFLQNPFHVRLYGFLGKEDRCGDLPVGGALGHQLQDLILPSRQIRNDLAAALPRRRRSPLIQFQQRSLPAHAAQYAPCRLGQLFGDPLLKLQLFDQDCPFHDPPQRLGEGGDDITVDLVDRTVGEIRITVYRRHDLAISDHRRTDVVWGLHLLPDRLKRARVVQRIGDDRRGAASDDQRLRTLRCQIVSRVSRKLLAVPGPLVVVGENGGDGLQHPTLTLEHHEALESGEVAHRRGRAFQQGPDPR